MLKTRDVLRIQILKNTLWCLDSHFDDDYYILHPSNVSLLFFAKSILICERKLLGVRMPWKRSWHKIFINFGEEFGGLVSLQQLSQNPDLWPAGVAIVVSPCRYDDGPFAAWRNPQNGYIYCIEQREPSLTVGAKKLLLTHRDLSDAYISLGEPPIWLLQATYREAKRRINQVAAANAVTTPVMCTEGDTQRCPPAIIRNKKDWDLIRQQWKGESSLICLVNGDKYKVHPWRDRTLRHPRLDERV